MITYKKFLKVYLYMLTCIVGIIAILLYSIDSKHSATIIGVTIVLLILAIANSLDRRMNAEYDVIHPINVPIIIKGTDKVNLDHWLVWVGDNRWQVIDVHTEKEVWRGTLAKCRQYVKDKENT